MLVGEQEEEWEASKAAPFSSLRIHSEAAPHWATMFANTPYINC